MCDTYNCDYLKNSTFCFNLIVFQLNADSLSNFAFFTLKSPGVTQIDRFLKKMLIKRAETRRLFFTKL